MRILAIESSTTSAKAMLYDSKDGVVGMLSEPYSEGIEQGATGAQDPEAVFGKTAEVARRLAADQKIDAVATGGTWHSIIALDQTKKAVTPSFTWAYTGAAETARKLRADEEFCNDFYQRTGCMIHAIYPAFKLMDLKKKGLDLSDKLFCSQSTYNIYKLTGAWAVSDSIASGAGLLNVHTRQWDPEALKMVGVREDQMCRLTTYRETFPLSREGAVLLGVKEGTPVLPGYPDGALNQVGAGALKPGVMTFSVGTSGALRMSVEKPILPKKPSTWCYLSPNGWLSGAATSGACNCLDWLKSKFFTPNIPYEAIEAQAGEVDDMPIFLPFLFGERCPGWNDEWRGGFFNLLPQHGPADMYHSVQEGVLFNLYHCYQMLCRENGEPREIQLSGGILNSQNWMQMCADIFGRPMDCADMPHASMLGAAMLAMENLGCIEHIEDFRADATETLIPDPDMHELYEKRFQLYLEQYERQLGNVSGQEGK